MIRVVVLHPRDLAAPTLGGIQTFLHDFVKHSPTDFDITVAGVTQDPADRPIGRRSRVHIGRRDRGSRPGHDDDGVLAGPVVDIDKRRSGRLVRHLLDAGHDTFALPRAQRHRTEIVPTDL